MGGEASAQISAAYFLMRDIRERVATQCRGFSFFRFRDNLPGILDTQVTTVEAIGHFFQDMYELPMKAGGCGKSVNNA